MAIGKTVLKISEIADIVYKLGASITETYRESTHELVVVGLLKGSFIFMADLVRAIDLPLRVDFMVVSSYGNETRGGNVKIIMDLGESIADKDVLLVEDIIDTGATLATVLDLLRGRGPASLRVCTLLDKPSRRIVKIPIDFKGAEIPDEFVCGYGLDYAQLHRNLPFVCTIDIKSRT
ncbi:MAG: hypoxanthine phosphoribosyltransferase [Chitinivibrionales bacterium]|nr:hypoxanthine phosphoribosyltransferase [Chitinivibrionales bacterium]MBD3357630.1 hypoxanthine phosphoribosyltransferase [Chitinivibrionales bacterium]